MQAVRDTNEIEADSRHGHRGRPMSIYNINTSWSTGTMTGKELAIRIHRDCMTCPEHELE